MFDFQMFTSGMRESKKDSVLIRDVSLEPFLVMIGFMYKGDFELAMEEESGSLLLSLLILADQFGVQLLQQKSIEVILEFLSEVCKAFLSSMLSSLYPHV